MHAVLETEGRQWREWFIGAIEAGGGSAQTKLARIFPALKHWFGQERFYGCPFINAVGEHDKDQKQLRAIAMRHKKVVLAHLEKLAAEMGATDPESLAHQLALLIDGAIVAAMVSRNPGVADTAGLAAGSLFGPAKLKKPKRERGAAIDGGVADGPEADPKPSFRGDAKHRTRNCSRFRVRSGPSDHPGMTAGRLYRASSTRVSSRSSCPPISASTSADTMSTTR